MIPVIGPASATNRVKQFGDRVPVRHVAGMVRNVQAKFTAFAPDCDRISMSFFTRSHCFSGDFPSAIACRTIERLICLSWSSEQFPPGNVVARRFASTNQVQVEVVIASELDRDFRGDAAPPPVTSHVAPRCGSIHGDCATDVATARTIRRPPTAKSHLDFGRPGPVLGTSHRQSCPACRWGQNRNFDRGGPFVPVPLDIERLQQASNPPTFWSTDRPRQAEVAPRSVAAASTQDRQRDFAPVAAATSARRDTAARRLVADALAMRRRRVMTRPPDREPVMRKTVRIGGSMER